MYLTHVEPLLAEALFRLIGSEAAQVKDVAGAVSAAERVSPAPEPTLEQWESRVEASINENAAIPETERKALVDARRGQGKFRSNVLKVERACRVTKVERPEHLIASHTKPWRDSSNEDRLNGENGLLLTPSIDHLFDKGFISFENNGDLLVSPVADPTSLKRMGITPERKINVGAFSEGQRRFLEYHRDGVLRMSNVSR